METGSDSGGRVRIFQYIPLYGEGFGTFHGGFEEMTISEYEYWGYESPPENTVDCFAGKRFPAGMVSNRKGLNMSGYDFGRLGVSVLALIVISCIAIFAIDRFSSMDVRGSGRGCQCETRWEDFRSRLKAMESRPYRIGSAGESK